jgi:hypothetical protein
LPNAIDKRRYVDIGWIKIDFLVYFLWFYLVIVEEIGNKSYTVIANAERGARILAVVRSVVGFVLFRCASVVVQTTVSAIRCYRQEQNQSG